MESPFRSTSVCLSGERRAYQVVFNTVQP